MRQRADQSRPQIHGNTLAGRPSRQIIPGLDRLRLYSNAMRPHRLIIGQGRCRDGRNYSQPDEDRIRRQAQPLEGSEDTLGRELGMPGMPVSIVQDVQELDHTSREEAGDDHQRQADSALSTVMTAGSRQQLSRAKAAKYLSAGTIEFLLDRSGHFYFMEMNTMIQVEHPVTEMVTGIDLVKEQIAVSAGEKLRHKQEDIQIKGAAIECRINAEDYENNFMPSPGKIEKLILPGGPGVRLDTHIYSGYEIPPFYDSLVAKLITYANTRQQAIGIMRRALSEFTISPIKTTIPFHLKLMTHPVFLKGNISTHFVQEMFAKEQERQANE